MRNDRQDDLYTAVEEELFRLRAEPLDRMPMAEEMPQVVRVMVENLQAMNLRDEDAARVREAIRHHGRTCTHWPRTVEIRRLLPAKAHITPEHQLSHQKKSYTDEEIKAIKKKGQAYLAQIRRSLVKT